MITDLKTHRSSENITDIIPLGDMPVISVVGAGGKTTIVKRIASEYGRAAISTTTHMYKEAEPAVCAEDVLSSQGIVWCGKDDGEKISRPDYLDSIKDIPLIIEADGSRHMPFKTPGEHEPQIYFRSTAVIGVLGLSALGKTIAQAAHRPEETARFLSVGTDHIITEEDFAVVITSSNGLKKNVSTDFYAILAQSQTYNLYRSAEKIAALCGDTKIYTYKID